MKGSSQWKARHVWGYDPEAPYAAFQAADSDVRGTVPAVKHGWLGNLRKKWRCFDGKIMEKYRKIHYRWRFDKMIELLLGDFPASPVWLPGYSLKPVWEFPGWKSLQESSTPWLGMRGSPSSDVIVKATLDLGCLYRNNHHLEFHPCEFHAIAIVLAGSDHASWLSDLVT